MTAYALGLMSGTSCDGVSLALCSFSNQKLTVHAHTNIAYPLNLQKRLLHPLDLKTSEISKLDFELGFFFASCAKKFFKQARVATSSLKVIGSHGHTLYHGSFDKPVNTLQIGEPSFLSEAFGVPVVSDFRPRDIAAGGSGAPLIPFFDAFLFSKKKNIALQNIGGIGNVTFLSPSKSPLAFDTGPGNCLLDLVIQKATQNRKLFDKNGALAARGKINFHTVKKMFQHPYFKETPPKSTGRELFNSKFISSVLGSAKLQDQLATLTYFTAFSIYQSYKSFLPRLPSEIVVSGGGSKNKTLMFHLQKLFARIPVRTIDDYGIPTQAKEPAAFAFFAWQAIRQKINHAPQGTGAKHARILGKITY